MRFLQNYIIHVLVTCIFSLSLMGCGGGTSGTGVDERARVSARILNQDRMPLAQVLVTELEEGASDTTDDDGVFEFYVDQQANEYTLEIERADGKRALVVLHGVETDAVASDRMSVQPEILVSEVLFK